MIADSNWGLVTSRYRMMKMSRSRGMIGTADAQQGVYRKRRIQGHLLGLGNVFLRL